IQWARRYKKPGDATEFTDCLWANVLENTLGLEAIQGQAGNMIEFSFDIGSFLLKQEGVRAEVREEMRGQPMIQETGQGRDSLYDRQDTRKASAGAPHISSNSQVGFQLFNFNTQISYASSWKPM